MADGRRVHPDCRNASNPYHECSEYCFKIIAKTLPRMDKMEPDSVQASGTISKPIMPLHDEDEDRNDERADSEQDDGKDEHADGENATEDFANLTGRKERLLEVHLKMNEARKTNQTAMIAEKKIMEAPSKSRGISNQKWIEEMKNVEDSLEEYNKMKEADPEFHRDASSLQYGKAPKTSDEKIECIQNNLEQGTALPD